MINYKNKIYVINKYSIILIVGLFILYYFPLLNLGYFSDDMGFVYLKNIDGLTTFQSIEQDIKNWLDTGRFIPISVFIYRLTFSIFSINHSHFYHLYIIFLTIFSILLFIKTIDKIGYKLDKIKFSAIYLISSQLRFTSDDPILAYHGLMQWISIFFFTSLLTLQSLEKNFKNSIFLVWITLNFIILLTYEIGFFILLMQFFIIYKFKYKNLRFFIGLTLTLFLYLFFNLYLRHIQISDTYVGINLSTNPEDILKSTFIQLSGSIPFSYYYYLLEILKFKTNKYDIAYYLINILIFFYILYLFIKSNINKNNTSQFLILGILLWILPAISVAISSYHSNWIKFGLSYIPVYLQNFGFSLILYLLLPNNKLNKQILSLLLVINLICTHYIFYKLSEQDGERRLLYNIIKSDIPLLHQYKASITYYGNNYLSSENINKIGGDKFGKLIYINNIYDINNNSYLDKKSGILLTSHRSYNDSLAILAMIESSDNFINPLLITPSKWVANNLQRCNPSFKFNIYEFHGLHLYISSSHIKLTYPVKICGFDLNLIN